MKTVVIDMVSDVVCPWCAVGYHRLKKAANNLGVQLTIHWHPFELNPNMPTDGEDLYAHFLKKYGMSADKTDGLGETLKTYGEPLGFEFNYPQGNRMRNTFKAHQLLAWSKLQGAETRLSEALFTAYFTHQQDIASTKVLLDIADSVDLDKKEAERILSQGDYVESVKTEAQKWIAQGIHSVPAMIFQDRYLVSGAQTIEHYEQQIV